MKRLWSHATIGVQLWKTFFAFAWANFSSLLAGRDRDCFCYTFIFVWRFVIIVWIQGRCMNQPFPPHLKKEGIIFERRWNCSFHQVDILCEQPAVSFQDAGAWSRSRAPERVGASSQTGTHATATSGNQLRGFCLGKKQIVYSVFSFAALLFCGERTAESNLYLPVLCANHDLLPCVTTIRRIPARSADNKRTSIRLSATVQERDDRCAPHGRCVCFFVVC